MKFIKRLFGLKRDRAPVIQPIFNESGVLLCSLREDGGMNMQQINVPGLWTGAKSLWYVGRPISLELSGDVVVMRRSINHALPSDVDVRVFDAKGNVAQAKALLVLMRQRWFEANSEAQAGFTSPVKSPKPFLMAQGARSPWIRRLGYGVGFVGMFAVGLGSMYYYLHPGGVGVDMTGMSIEDVAKIDSNPAILRDVQEQMIAAVGVGKDNAKKISGKIEQDHIAALKAMGLDTGVSMSNALKCLAK